MSILGGGGEAPRIVHCAIPLRRDDGLLSTLQSGRGESGGSVQRRSPGNGRHLQLFADYRGEEVCRESGGKGICFGGVQKCQNGGAIGRVDKTKSKICQFIPGIECN